MDGFWYRNVEVKKYVKKCPLLKEILIAENNWVHYTTPSVVKLGLFLDRNVTFLVRQL